MSKIFFDPVKHKYHLDSGRELISCSTLVKKYSQPFDETGEILINKAKKLGKTPEELQKEWDKTREDACKLGTKYHKEVEYWVQNKKIQKNGEFKDVVKQLTKIDFGGPLTSGVIVFNSDLGIAGTIDLISDLGNNVKYLWDHKTNRELKWKGFFRKGQGYQKMLYPLNHLMDCNVIHYFLQLSLYWLILEKNGSWINGAELLYVNPKTRLIERYPVEFLEQDATNMLDHYYNRKVKERKIEVEDFGF
jgi:hypothetical protein